jgi:hypothetical protein
VRLDGSSGSTALVLPPSLGLDAAGNVPQPRDDDFGLALCAAAVAVWCPHRWHIAAGVLAMLGQQGQVAQRNGGRFCSHIGFFVKEVQRVGATMRVPPQELTTKQLAAAEPLLQFNSAGAPGGIVMLQVPALAAVVAAAARGVPGAGAVWPPPLRDLPVGQLHQQAQPIARLLAHVLAGGEGPDAAAALLGRCQRQLEALAALHQSSVPGPAPNLSPMHSGAAPGVQPTIGGPQQHLLGGAGPASGGMGVGGLHPAQQAAMMGPPGQIGVQAMTPSGEVRFVTLTPQQREQLAAHAAQAMQQMQLQQQQQPPQGFHTARGLGGGGGGGGGGGPAPQQPTPAAMHVAQKVAQVVQSLPPEGQQPLLRALQLITLAYPAADPASVLRRTAALHLLVTLHGVAGPHALPLSELAPMLRGEDLGAWAALFDGSPDVQLLRDVSGLFVSAAAWWRFKCNTSTLLAQMR